MDGCVITVNNQTTSSTLVPVKKHPDLHSRMVKRLVADTTSHKAGTNAKRGKEIN